MMRATIQKLSFYTNKLNDQNKNFINTVISNYSQLILNKKGSAIKSSKDVNKGENLKARLSKGTIDIEVK